METRKIPLLSTGLVAAVALFTASHAVAQNECTSVAIDKNGVEVPGNFRVTVNETLENGRRIYTYSVASLTGAKANKFFVWVRQGINSEEGFNIRRIDSDGTSTNTNVTYLTPGNFAGNFPPPEAWWVAHHEDGVVWTNIAIGNQFEINVKERFAPDTSLTTVLLGNGNSFEHCGPIFGPKNPDVGQEGPLVVTTAHLAFENGCSYFAGVDPRTNYVISLTPDPATPQETVNCGGNGQPVCQLCQVDNNADCAGDLGLVFCPRLRVGENPIQSEEGGTCYFPANIKFPC